MEQSWIILIPTILTIIVCLATKKIFVGMFVGIFSGCIILAGGNPLTGLGMSFDKLIAVVASGWNMKIILFATLIGGMIKLMQVSGAVNGLIRWLQRKAKVTTPAKAQFLTWLIGVVLFFDQYTSEAVTATIGKTLANNYGYSREKVAYLVDSTASPMCALLPLNSWGAYIIGLLATLGVADTMGVMVKALPFNFYCIIALAICLIVIFKNWNIGGMKAAEMAVAVKTDEEEQADEKTATPWLVVLPILVIIACVIGGQYITGKGVFSDGDTSTSVFYAMLIGNVVTILMCMACAKMKYNETVKACGQGILEMVPVAMLSGAIMGDHCSMISDSTVMASAFSGCDNVSHFRTQLPYALLSAGIAAVLYLVVGFVM